MDVIYKFVSAVIYIYNEEKYIQTYIRTVYDFLKGNFQKYEIICVDDASTDNTISEIQDLVQNDGLDNITLVSMSIHQGRERGMEAGVDLSIGDYVYELEWIDVFDIESYSDKLYEAFKKSISGYDIVVYPSSSNKGMGSIFFYMIYNTYNYNSRELSPERFRLVTRRAINRVSNMDKSIVYRKALYANSGLKVYIINNDKKKAKHNIRKTSNKNKLGVNALLAYTDFVPKVISLLLIILLAIFMCVVIGNNSFKVSSDNIIMMILSLIGIILGLIGLIIVKYCELILELTLKKEKYIVSSVEKLSNREDIDEKES